MLSLNDHRQVTEKVCEHCGEPRVTVTGSLLRDGDYLAAYFASCYHHDGHEVWIDIVYSLDRNAGDQQHVTFGCRVGPVSNSPSPAATMVDAAAAWGDEPYFGRKLSREEAMAHPWRDEYWSHVDHILVNDPDVALHMGYR
jgi:hypothetical protein